MSIVIHKNETHSRCDANMSEIGKAGALLNGSTPGGMHDVEVNKAGWGCEGNQISTQSNIA